MSANIMVKDYGSESDWRVDAHKLRKLGWYPMSTNSGVVLDTSDGSVNDIIAVRYEEFDPSEGWNY